MSKLYFLLILIISFTLVAELFFIKGRASSFDGVVHITNIEQFSRSLREGDFPVTWSDGFANYGMPIPLIAQQTTNYIGAVVSVIFNDPVFSYNIVLFLGILLSCLFYFFFLRIYFPPPIAFLGTFLFNLSSYRIIDIYIRADLPEIFASSLLPLILIGFYFWIRKKKKSALILIALSFFLVSLTHPMMLPIFSLIYLPYLFLNYWLEFSSNKTSKRRLIKNFIFCFLFIFIGVGMAAYYLIPLNVEIKYFVQGQYSQFLASNQFLGLNNFINPNWYFFTKYDVFTRGHFIKTGLLETGLVVAGVFVVLLGLKKRKFKDEKFLTFSLFVFISIVVMFLTTKYAQPLYTHIFVLDRILFPWRLLSVFIFLPPFICAYLLNKINNKILLLIFVFGVCVIRFPQIYGKNYANYPRSEYMFIRTNLYSDTLNTLWTGDTRDYPVKVQQADIIGGKGEILNRELKNSSRKYKINAKTNLRMVDYTFYFPGWKVYVDGKEVPVEFQDINYRGVITYEIPTGMHDVLVQFEDTKIRLIGKLISLVFMGILLSIVLGYWLKPKLFRL